MHKEGDIRRQAAELMGDILARFHAGYTKEVPAHHVPDPREQTALGLAEGYLHRILYPDHKLLPQHKRWINYTLKRVIATLVDHSQGAEQRAFLELCLGLYAAPERLDDTSAFTLLDTATSLPLRLCTPEQRQVAGAFCRRPLPPPGLNGPHRRPGRAGVPAAPGGGCRSPDGGRLRPARPGQRQSRPHARTTSPLRWRGLPEEDAVGSLEDEDISEIFLENLKAATPWIIKKANIRIPHRLCPPGPRLPPNRYTYRPCWSWCRF